MTAPTQRALALVLLIVAAPVIAVLGVAVLADSRRPVLHRSIRVRPGGTFTMYKLRTMRVTGGPGITAAADPRVTRVGRFLRKSKLDELPQLWNVVKGDMALVGPRPEDPRYVDLSDHLHATVFGALPGITGPTALAFRDEEEVLVEAATAIARADGREVPLDQDLDRAYRDVVLPAKLAMDAEYLKKRSWRGDLKILGMTFGHVLRRRGRP